MRVHHPAVFCTSWSGKDWQDIGYLTINEADEITLQSLYISAEYQRQGIGRQAFDFESVLQSAPYRLCLPLCRES